MQPFTFFISYRREDTAPIALLLKSEIEKRLQFVRVAVDVQDIKAGDVFPDRLKNLIDSAHVTIALIGKNWMKRRDDSAAPAPVQYDWVVNELVYSNTAPLAQSSDQRNGLEQRRIIPLFANCERKFDQFYVPSDIAYLTTLNAEEIAYADWPHAIGPLIERIAIQLNLKKRPDKDEYPKADLAKARTQPLPDTELATILGYDDFEGWYVDNFGDAEVRYLAKTFKFRNFNRAAVFMELVSAHCRVIDHHPEWRNVFNHVTVALTTWDARRRVTIYDLALALFMNMAAKRVTRNV